MDDDKKASNDSASTSKRTTKSKSKSTTTTSSTTTTTTTKQTSSGGKKTTVQKVVTSRSTVGKPSISTLTSTTTTTSSNSSANYGSLDASGIIAAGGSETSSSQRLSVIGSANQSAVISGTSERQSSSTSSNPFHEAIEMSQASDTLSTVPTPAVRQRTLLTTTSRQSSSSSSSQAQQFDSKQILSNITSSNASTSANQQAYSIIPSEINNNQQVKKTTAKSQVSANQESAILKAPIRDTAMFEQKTDKNDDLNRKTQGTSMKQDYNGSREADDQSIYRQPRFKSDSSDDERRAILKGLDIARLPQQPMKVHTSKSNLLPKDHLQRRPYPKKVFFIVANEFCERFSFYGLRTILVLYLKNVLGFSDSNSTVTFHLFATLCYLTPILGAILGDSILGKFNTILYLSIVYFIGELLLVISSIFWYQGLAAVIYFFLGLFMIGLGTGGIKPCVSALGGDQFLSHEDKWRQSFFSLFYGAINLGSLISMFSVPVLRSQFRCVSREDCYPLAFGLPCLLMLVSIIVFAIAKNQYNIAPLPERNIIVSFCQCIWLGLKRKFGGGGNNLQETNRQAAVKYSTTSNDTSSSTLSATSLVDGELLSYANKLALEEPEISGSLGSQKDTKTDDVFTAQFEGSAQPPKLGGMPNLIVAPEESENDGVRDDDNDSDSNHWLYSTADRFDRKTIEEFRSVLGILLIFVPLPVYWCLFDQQSSLWTLQASRMNGNVFGFTLQPDQMSVANPLLLLASIPIFEIIIYPSLKRYNILTKPIQRMTFGGLLAALAFVASAAIEFRIQKHLPPSTPAPGRANLIFINGLAGCSIIEPTILNVRNVGNATNITVFETGDHNLTRSVLTAIDKYEPFQEGELKPLHVAPIEVVSAEDNSINNYQVNFKLNGDMNVGASLEETTTTTTTTNQLNQCPFNTGTEQQLNVGALPDRSVKLLYIEHGNGKITYKLFNETLDLPAVGKARVRLVYESFGSSSEAQKRQFYLSRHSKVTQTNESTSISNKFKTFQWDGQVLASDYLDLDVAQNGEFFELKTSDPNLNLYSSSNNKIFIEPGTRSLVVAHQKNGTFVELKFQMLQDNKYQISMLYQLFPYLLISVSEVMFSITGLEFSYSMAPETMKSVILAAWNLTTAFGNILTVAVESLHLFSNVGFDFLFYATLMALDMILFAIVGYYYKPYRGQKSNLTNAKELTEIHSSAHNSSSNSSQQAAA